MRKNGFRDVLAVGEFRALWSAEIVSVAGDQLARVGLSILVYQRTSSIALTALTYALTFVPALLGGALLSGLADRFPRRSVLVGTDLVRAALAGLMAVPGLPLPVLWALVFGLALAGAPFKAAQLALLPQVLSGERYPVGLSLRMVSAQLTQLVGFVLGGSALLVVSAPAVLGINALTFIFSALVVRLGVGSRPAAADPRTTSSRSPSSIAAIISRGRLAPLVGLVWLAGLTVAPEGVAAPYATGLGGSAVAVGLLLAADPLGSALGGWWSAHGRSPETHRRAMVPVAVCSGLVLVPCTLRLGVVPSVVLWASCGACSTFVLVQAQAVLTRSVPDARRGVLSGLLSGGLQASQGIAVLAAGVLGEQVGVYRTVGLVGVATAATAMLLGLLMRRARPRSETAIRDGHSSGHEMSDKEVRGPGYAFAHLPPRIGPIGTR